MPVLLVVVTVEGRRQLQLASEQHAALTGQLVELRDAAMHTLHERAAAKVQNKLAADALKRAAGRADITKLTVPLIIEELKLRRSRGEAIAHLPSGSRRDAVLQLLVTARAAAPDIPDIPAPAAGPAPTAAAADPSLVGRLAMATYLDEAGEEQWCAPLLATCLTTNCEGDTPCHANRYRATVVKYNPDARTYPFLLHFELDGEVLDVSFPDPTVKLLEGSVTHCKCLRCRVFHLCRLNAKK